MEADELISHIEILIMEKRDKAGVMHLFDVYNQMSVLLCEVSDLRTKPPKRFSEVLQTIKETAGYN